MRKTPRDKTQSTPERDKANFAREITRAEFGRYYWDDQRAAEVRRACGDRKKRPRET